MDENFENWEQNAPLPDVEAELKRIRRDIRKRNWKIILTSLVLAAALLIGAVKFAIPALESRYWDPYTSTYIEEVPDLELTMIVYGKLFGQGQLPVNVSITKTGFAAYSIETGFMKSDKLYGFSWDGSRTATLSKGELSFPSNFWESFERYVFDFTQDEDYKYSKDVIRLATKKLKRLPDYAQVLAIVSFSEDLPLSELMELEQDLMSSDYESGVLWAALRTCDPSSGTYPFCGIRVQFTGYQTTRYAELRGAQSPYPYLFESSSSWTADTLEQHITSLLQFSQDQCDKGTGILPEGAGSDYYQTALDYMSENGINTYGCYVIATPAELLQILSDYPVYHISLVDAWLV